MKRTMMLIDDNLTLIKNIEDYFSDKYEIVLAEGPVVALNKLEKMERPPSIIITDQQMPVMTGLDLILQALKLVPNLKHSTLLIMSAFSGQDGGESIQAAKREGIINGFICKSTPLKNYEALIEDAISDNERRRKEEDIDRQLRDLKQKNETLVLLNVKRVNQDPAPSNVIPMVRSKRSKAA